VVSAVVSISVGFILFDGGLDLKLSDLRGAAVAKSQSATGDARDRRT